jgi:molybdopterin-guanine dinucleotide biosynthesis protein A
MVSEGFVLAGGLGTRMGVDKARAPFGGLTLAAFVAEQLMQVVSEVALIRRADDGLPWLDRDGDELTVHYEPDHPSRHPLWGVAEALRVARQPLVLVVPCDLVGLRPEHLQRLVEYGRPCVAHAEGQRHPLLAVLSRHQLPRAVSLAARGAAAGELSAELHAVALPAEALVDANTPERLGRTPLQALAGRLGPERATERLLAGERARLAQRGVLDPYVSPPGA